MDEQFLTPSRFKILVEIASQPSSASEIARRIGMSIPYILNQLTILEAKNIITKKEQTNNHNPGKPKKFFSLTQPILNITFLKEGFGKRFSINQPSEKVSVYFQLISFINKRKQGEFSKYYWSNLEEFDKIIALGHIDTHDDKVELLAITTTEHLDKLRKSISSQTIKIKGEKPTQFACWVHSFDELKKGVESNDFHYENLRKRVTVMYDPQELFTRV